MQKLFKFFTEGVTSQTLRTIGSEIETQFVDSKDYPITVETSQKILLDLSQNGWSIIERKGNLITVLTDQNGNKMFYELGHHNIELATRPAEVSSILGITQFCLDQLYVSALKFGAFPYFGPILQTNEDLIVIPDERDATWLLLDGKENLLPLAATSSVQFTFSVSQEDAILILNKLGQNVGIFLSDYSQDIIWQKYIRESKAGYLVSRYGGPLVFNSLEDYCQKLTENAVVSGNSLIPFSDVNDLDIPIFIRSVWWFFRLKRYDNDLCVEVRPMPRREDEHIQSQLNTVLDIINA